jgi:hypothetical protein
LATAIFLAFRQHRQLTPSAWEPLAKLAGRVLQPRFLTQTIQPNSPNGNLWNEIKPWLVKRRSENGTAQLEVNFILTGFPELWQQYNWQDALARFKDDLKLFGVKDAD